ncbi:SUMF1/EgtB/PvdO family nonheme iron enzyme [Enhygromyxa salina]|uniref:Serine/threonine-protein kinase pkn1 n=1 Tax=Enhygromyxa salina TaxID=215803 RepID=A0A2S9YYQ1_9BACT|nr:SUMF1/EgtB/PvdO family nonheme iron enzyme [Enhygromyxa salina]PRQ10189.1 Serine/threonine-protein kinase pkn1 [Enhygromyxa salina]
MSRADWGTSAREAEAYLADVYATHTGFELVVVTSAEQDDRVALRKRLQQHGARIEVVEPSLAAVAEAPVLEADQPGGAVRWIELRDDASAEEAKRAWRELAVALNRSRDRLRSRHRYVWVLAGPLWLRRIMTVHAQDIYSGAFKAPHVIARRWPELGWLHIPSLQFDTSGAWTRLSSVLLTDLDGTLDREMLDVDVVFISGDLTAHGQPAEFEQVDSFLLQLCSRLERRSDTRPLVLAVPGDRDMQRERPAFERWCEVLDGWNQRSGSGNGAGDPLLDASIVSSLELLFANYLDWARRWAPQTDMVGMKPSVGHVRDWVRSHLPGDWSVIIEKDDWQVGIQGFNTVWASRAGGTLGGRIACEQLAAVSHESAREVRTWAGLIQDLSWVTGASPETSRLPRSSRWDLCLHSHGCARSSEEPSPIATPWPDRIIPGRLSGSFTRENSEGISGYSVGRLNAETVRVKSRFWVTSGAEQDWRLGSAPWSAKAQTPWGAKAALDTTSVSSEEIERYQLDMLERSLGQPKSLIEPRLTLSMPASDRELSESLSVPAAFALLRERGGRVLSVGGPFGSGRTCLLAWVWRELVAHGPGSLGLPEDTVPIYVPVQGLTGERRGLGDLIQTMVSRSRFADLGTRLFRRGRLLLMFDGLDEIPDLRDHAEVIGWIEEILDGLSDSLVIVTHSGVPSPSFGAGSLPLRLPPLDFDQIRALVRQWHERDDSGSPRPDALVEQLALAPDPASERLAEFAHSPGWLALLWKEVLAHGGPFSYWATIDLYREGLRAELVGYAFLSERKTFEALAAWIHEQRGRRWASASEWHAAIEQTRASSDHVTTEGLLERGLMAGMLRRRGDQLGFTHVGIQEYLTAAHLREHHRVDELAKVLVERLDDGWWREVISMVLMDDPQDYPLATIPFLHACASHPSFPHWAGSPMLERMFDVPAVKNGLVRISKRVRERLLQPASIPPSRIEAPRGGVELSRVPGGPFTMGAPDSEPGGTRDERSVHELTLDAFYIARTPVTNTEYGRYLRANPGTPTPRFWDDRRFNQPEQPVVGVSWDEASAYCDWAGLALPTEAQWERACRAGTTTRFHAGDNEADLARVGWYARNADGRVHAVRTRDPNALGLFDMHGNVREWCRDDFGSYAKIPRVGDGLRHPPSETGSRVYRGGSYLDGPAEARSAARRPILPSYRLDSLGFRPIALVSGQARPSVAAATAASQSTSVRTST